MTNLTNYLSHCLYCDGRANMEDFIRFAISEGFTSYGISSHAPLPFSTAWTMEWDRMDDYLSEFSRLKKKYADKIELAIGLEIDYLNEESNPSLPCFQKLSLDYRIGSVHMLYSPEGKIVDIDTPADLFRQLVDKHFDGDLDSVVHLYYKNLLRMVELEVLILSVMLTRCIIMLPVIVRDYWMNRGMMHWFANISPPLPNMVISLK